MITAKNLLRNKFTERENRNKLDSIQKTGISIYNHASHDIIQSMITWYLTPQRGGGEPESGPEYCLFYIYRDTRSIFYSPLAVISRFADDNGPGANKKQNGYPDIYRIDSTLRTSILLQYSTSLFLQVYVKISPRQKGLQV